MIFLEKNRQTAANRLKTLAHSQGHRFVAVGLMVLASPAFAETNPFMAKTKFIVGSILAAVMLASVGCLGVVGAWNSWLLASGKATLENGKQWLIGAGCLGGMSVFITALTGIDVFAIASVVIS